MESSSESRRKAILHIGIDASRATAPQATGTENYSRHLIDGLLSIDRAHQYTLYMRGSTGYYRGPQVREQLVGPTRFWTHYGLSVEMLRRPPDVLFVPAHVLPLVRPHRSVVTVHDLGYLYFPQAHPLGRWWYLHLSTLFHGKVATAVIADSYATKRDLVQRYGMDPGKITVVYLGVDDGFRPIAERDKEVARARFAGGRDYLLFVGTVYPRKNVDGLLAAYADLRRHTQRAPALVIAGRRGWQADALFDEAGRRGLLEGVNVVEYVPRADLPLLYGGALALAFPSHYEGFGLPALEAMASGIPVVAADNSSLPEVVGDGGLLVDCHDLLGLSNALERLVGDAGLRADLADRGIRRAANFTWARCAAETLAVLEKAAGWLA